MKITKAEMRLKAEREHKQEQEKNKFLETIPLEFRKVLYSWAYEIGHSYGWYDIMVLLEDWILNFRPAVEAYRLRIEEELRTESADKCAQLTDIRCVFELDEDSC